MFAFLTFIMVLLLLVFLLVKKSHLNYISIDSFVFKNIVVFIITFVVSFDYKITM